MSRRVRVYQMFVLPQSGSQRLQKLSDYMRKKAAEDSRPVYSVGLGETRIELNIREFYFLCALDFSARGSTYRTIQNFVFEQQKEEGVPGDLHKITKKTFGEQQKSIDAKVKAATKAKLGSIVEILPARPGRSVMAKLKEGVNPGYFIDGQPVRFQIRKGPKPADPQ